MIIIDLEWLLNLSNIIIFIPFDGAFVSFTVVPKYAVVPFSTAVVPLLSWEAFEPSVDIAIPCSDDTLPGVVVVIFREPGKLSIDVILLEVDEPSVDVAISCSVDKLFRDVVVIFRESGKLSGDVILLEVDEPSVNVVVKLCEKEKR